MADLSMVFDLLAKDRASAEVEKVGKSMDDAGDKAGGLGDKIGGMFSLAAGAAAGAGLAVGAAFFGAIDQQSQNVRLTAQLGLDPADAAAAGKIAGDLYADNYGDSLEQVNEAVAAVAANVTGINDPDFSEITSKALDLSSTFGVDLAGSTRAVSNLMATGLVQDSAEAFDVITAGFQQGNDRAGDWLDTLTEYAPQFQKLGLSGAAATNLISQGLAAGARDSDLVADALKEFSIRAIDGSDTTIAGFQAIGLNARAMADQIGNGGADASDALNQVFTGLRNIQDPVARAAAATNLFGTQAEDLGAALYSLNPAAAASARATDGMTGASDRLDATLAQGVGPRLEALKRGAQQAASEGLSALINGFTQGSTTAGGWQGAVQNAAAALSSFLGPALSTIGNFLTGTVVPALAAFGGWVVTNKDWLIPLAAAIGAVVIALQVYQGVQAAISLATRIWTAAQAALNIVMSANPIGIIILAIVALVAAFVAAWNSSETFRNVVTGVLSWVGNLVSTVVGAIVGFFTQTLPNAIGTVISWFGSLPGRILNALVSLGQTIQNAFVSAIQAGVTGLGNAAGAIWDFFKSIPGRIWDFLKGMGGMLVDLGQDMIQGLIDGAGKLLKNIGKFFLDLLPGWIKGPFESILGIGSPSKVFAGYGRNIGEGLIDGLSGMQSEVQAAVGGLGASVALGYSAPGYDLTGPAGGAAGAGVTHTTIVSGVTGPEEVAAIVRRDQATTEFLAGV